MEWTYQSLSGGWQAMGRDPIRVLLPAAGILLLQAAWIALVRDAVLTGDPTGARWVGGAGAVVVIAALGLHLVQVPLRLGMLRAGGRAVGIDVRPRWSAIFSLLLVDTLTLVVQAAIASVVIVPTALVGALALSREVPVIAALVVSAGLLIGALGWAAARTLFAYAPAHILTGAGPITSLIEGLRDANRDRLGVLAIAAVGQAMFAAGGLSCGAGALPGYPFAELALLHRWRSMPRADG
jgi:hypothetical protein